MHDASTTLRFQWPWNLLHSFFYYGYDIPQPWDMVAPIATSLSAQGYVCVELNTAAHSSHRDIVSTVTVYLLLTLPKIRWTTWVEEHEVDMDMKIRALQETTPVDWQSPCQEVRNSAQLRLLTSHSSSRGNLKSPDTVTFSIRSSNWYICHEMKLLNMWLPWILCSINTRSQSSRYQYQLTDSDDYHRSSGKQASEFQQMAVW